LVCASNEDSKVDRPSAHTVRILWVLHHNCTAF